MAGRSEMMMPVPDVDAAKLIEIEVLRGINRNLEKLNERSDETLEKMHAMDARLIRIEANKVDRNLEAVTKRVDELEADRERRDGALGFANALRTWIPFLVMTIVIIVVVLKANGRI